MAKWKRPNTKNSFWHIILKRLSDKFDGDKETLRKNYESKNLAPELIEKQLERESNYDFLCQNVPDGKISAILKLMLVAS